MWTKVSKYLTLIFSSIELPRDVPVMWRNCAGKLRARVKAVKHQDFDIFYLHFRKRDFVLISILALQQQQQQYQQQYKQQKYKESTHCAGIVSTDFCPHSSVSPVQQHPQQQFQREYEQQQNIKHQQEYEQQQKDAHLVPGIVPTDFGLLSSASNGRFSLSSRSSQLSLLMMMMMAMIVMMTMILVVASLFSIAGNNHKKVAVKTYFISLTLRISHWRAQQDNLHYRKT